MDKGDVWNEITRGKIKKNTRVKMEEQSLTVQTIVVLMQIKSDNLNKLLTQPC